MCFLVMYSRSNGNLVSIEITENDFTNVDNFHGIHLILKGKLLSNASVTLTGGNYLF